MMKSGAPPDKVGSPEQSVTYRISWVHGQD